MAAAAALCASCSSLKQPHTVFSPPDYTAQDVIDNEKRLIEKMAPELPVKALWRAFLLKDDATLQKMQANLFTLLQKAVEEKKYADALKYYQSLESTGYADFADLPKSYQTLTADFLRDVPGFSPSPAHFPKTIPDCINATVTIWVDRGIKVENGAGFADRVIGSGFFIDRRGYVVTNQHVISDLVDPKHEGYTRLFIKPAHDDSLRIPAKVIGWDAMLDMALLKAEVEPPFILELGSGAQLAIGDTISAIGAPLGLNGTITSGIVSNVDRKLFSGGGVFQIDTPINAGNSGGPCIDAKMRVQAIAFAGIQKYQGLNFAIPIEYLRQDLPFLYSGGKRNHVWLGAFGRTKKYGQTDSGLEIQYVMPGGSANRAGMAAGDVITGAGDRAVDNLEALQTLFRSHIPETIVPCTFLHDGQDRRALVYLDERPENPGYEMYRSDLLSRTFIPIFGMELEPSSTVFSRKFTVANIIGGSIADEWGFSVTDPIYVMGVEFLENNSVIAVDLNTRKKKKGYLDISMRVGSQLDGPYYF